MNLLPAAVTGGDNGLWLEFSEHFRLPIPSRKESGVRVGQHVVAGLRTEDMTPANGNLPKDWIADGVVEVVEPLGGETHLHMDFDGVKFIARTEGSRIVRSGMHLAMGMNLNRLHIFDAESRQAIY